MKEFNIQADFPVSVLQFFELFFHSPTFKLDFHVARGDSEISVGDWKQTGHNKHERAVKFSSQVSDQPIFKKLTGGLAPVVHEKQDYEFVGKELRVATVATSSAGGFNCATTADYTITDINAGKPNGSVTTNGKHSEHVGCHVDIVVKCEFKSRLFKGQVENMMNQQASQTFEQWIALVKTKIAEFNKEEQLRRQNIQPSPLPEYLTDTLSSTPSTTENSEYDTDDEPYFDARDQLISPPLSRTSTPVPHLQPSSTSTSSTSSIPHSGGLVSLVHSMQKELQQVRSMTEVNTSRLLGLEASKLPPSTSAAPAINNEGILPYLQRLDVLVQQQEEETQRSRDKEQEWRRKLEEMEAKVAGMNAKGSLVPGGWWTVMILLLVWPVVARKIWKFARLLQPSVVTMFWRLLGR